MQETSRMMLKLLGAFMPIPIALMLVFVGVPNKWDEWTVLEVFPVIAVPTIWGGMILKEELVVRMKAKKEVKN